MCQNGDTWADLTLGYFWHPSVLPPPPLGFTASQSVRSIFQPFNIVVLGFSPPPIPQMGIISHLGQILYFKNKHIMFRRLKGCVFLCNPILCHCNCVCVCLWMCVCALTLPEFWEASLEAILTLWIFFLKKKCPGRKWGCKSSRAIFVCSRHTCKRACCVLPNCQWGLSTANGCRYWLYRETCAWEVVAGGWQWNGCLKWN